MSADDIDELYGLLVPLADERLIAPRACVAEVIAWQEPAQMPGAPSWYVGTVQWSGKSIPVISFEGAMGRSIPPTGGRTRIVVGISGASGAAPESTETGFLRSPGV